VLRQETLVPEMNTKSKSIKDNEWLVGIKILVLVNKKVIDLNKS